jgi:uncharacterized protein YjdB
MNTKNIKYSVVGLIAACILGLSSCEDDREKQAAAEEATVYSSIKIEETGFHADSVTIYLLKGQELQLSYTITPSESVTFSGVVWTSSNEAAVKVTQDGKITAQDVGQAVVQLTPAIGFGATNAMPAVTVNVLSGYVYMDTVKIVNPQAEDEMVDVGQTYQLAAEWKTVSGEPPTFVKYKWTSSNPAVVAVDEKTGLVRGVGQGEATITCAADDQNPEPPAMVTATTVIKVRQITPIKTFELVSEPELTALGYGQKYQIKFNVTPENATVSSIKWESDNAAAVSVDGKGLLTVNVMDAAMATITATAGEIVRTVSVAVAQGRLCYSFAEAFMPWTVTTDGAMVQSSDGTKTTIQMSNPTNDGAAKHRGDINLVTNNSGAIMVVYPKEYRYLAVKIQFPTVLVSGNNSQGCIKLEMFDNPRTIGPVYTGNTASNQNNMYTILGADAISTAEPNVLVFDLSETQWSGNFTTNTNPYNLVQFKFVIADYPVAAPWTYDIYWVRTFKTMEELTNFASAN